MTKEEAQARERCLQVVKDAQAACSTRFEEPLPALRPRYTQRHDNGIHMWHLGCALERQRPGLFWIGSGSIRVRNCTSVLYPMLFPAVSRHTHLEAYRWIKNVRATFQKIALTKIITGC